MTGGDLDLRLLSEVMERSGWDVSLGDSLVAVRVALGGVIKLTADVGGRLLLTLTRQQGTEEVSSILVDGRQYSCYRRRIEEISVPLWGTDPEVIVERVEGILQAIMEAYDDYELH